MIDKMTYPKGIEVAVGPFIINEKQQLLLFRSPKWKDEWLVPCGHVEVGEKLQDAVVRETMEEIGVEIEVIDLFNVGESFVSPPEFKRNAHFIFIDFVAKLKSDNFIFNDEISDCKWFDLDEAIQNPEVKDTCRRAIIKLQAWLASH